MNIYIYNDLGFAVHLFDPPMITLRGEQVPNINTRTIQHQVFSALTRKASRLTGNELRFVRTYRRLRQAELATVLHLANHSRVSQWEARGDQATGMEYNTEVMLRLWMQRQLHGDSGLAALLDGPCSDLGRDAGEPVVIHPAA